MSDLTCSECGEPFEIDEFPFGNDVRCPRCGVWLKTEMEESWDSLCCWVSGKADDQNQKADPPPKD